MSFRRAYLRNVRKGDVIFSGDDLDDVLLILKRTKNIVKAEDVTTGKTVWIAEMKFNNKNYYFLERE